ncbi:MAG: hypothetical protein PWP54_1483 [Thermosipho sp. (in: thermotogales)]|nr:hypothetical protein [Thermosipho sp. (in: thermotogales)]
MRKVLIFIFLFLVVVSISQININHLEFLGEDFVLNGEIVRGYFVYADKTSDGYRKIPAKGEGDVCVDDVARVVVTYVEMYELTGDKKYLDLAKKAAKFIVKMQDYDGDFYNFAYIDGTINKTGITSSKQHSWWAVRAFWALSKIAKYDTTFLENAKKAYELLSNYVVKGLLNGVGDQTTVYIIGLCALNDLGIDVKKEIRNSADAILELYLYGFFNTYKEKILWHGWGNRYVEALVESYKVLKDKKYLEYARKALEIEGPIFLSTGFIYEISDKVKLFPELSYAVESITVGAIKYYLETKDEEIGILASLMAGWYKGLNRLGKPMYGPNGEGYDGLEFAHINYNAGAESTISAVRTMLFLEMMHEYLKKFSEGKVLKSHPLIVLEAEAGDWGLSDVKVLVDGKFGGSSALSFEDNLRLKFNVPTGFYDIVVVGNGEYDCTVISGNDKLSGVLNENYVHLGKLNLGQFKVVLKGNGIIDQVVLIPEKIGISTTDISIFYENGTLKIKEEKVDATEVENKTENFVTFDIVKNFLLFDLENVLNNNGIADSINEKGNFDNLGSVLGSYLPEEIIDKVKEYKIPFKIFTKGNDNIRCNGQIIKFEKVFVKNLYLLVAANHGNYNVSFMVNDKKFEVEIPDWCSEKVEIISDYRFTSTGEKQFIKCGLKVLKLEINDFIDEIKLPNEINVHIFSITGEQ